MLRRTEKEKDPLPLSKLSDILSLIYYILIIIQSILLNILFRRAEKEKDPLPLSKQSDILSLIYHILIIIQFIILNILFRRAEKEKHPLPLSKLSDIQRYRLIRPDIRHIQYILPNILV